MVADADPAVGPAIAGELVTRTRAQSPDGSVAPGIEVSSAAPYDGGPTPVRAATGSADGFLPVSHQRSCAMTREFTDDDREKEVLTAEGDRIGRIRDVDGERATVERDDEADLPEKLREMLGWDDPAANELHGDHVEEDTADDLRLKSNW